MDKRPDNTSDQGKKIRILNIAQCAGGVDIYLRMLLANMNKSKFSNSLICSYDFDRVNYEGNVEEFIQVNMCNPLSFWRDLRSIRKVRKLIKKINPDIIYCHSSKAGGIGRIANIGLGIPLVYNPHGWAFIMQVSNHKRRFYQRVERFLAHFTTAIITISNYEKLIAIKENIVKQNKIKTIFSGIDMEVVDRQLAESTVTRESLGIPSDAVIVGMVGRISDQKAPDKYVQMAKILKERLPKAYFMIVGDGGRRVETEKLIAENGLTDCFTITGWVQNPIAYTNLFDIAVLLSRWEGFGLVLVEYMRLEKPIVATKANAIPDLIIDHENGLLVNIDDYQQAADAVMEIHENKDLRDYLVKKGRMRVEAFFDIKRTAMETGSFFEKVYSYTREK